MAAAGLAAVESRLAQPAGVDNHLGAGGAAHEEATRVLYAQHHHLLVMGQLRAGRAQAGGADRHVTGRERAVDLGQAVVCLTN